MITDVKMKPLHLLASNSFRALFKLSIISKLRELTGGFAIETTAQPVAVVKPIKIQAGLLEVNIY